MFKLSPHYQKNAWTLSLIMDFKPFLKIAEEEVKNKHTRENKNTFKKIFLIQVIKV